MSTTFSDYLGFETEYVAATGRLQASMPANTSFPTVPSDEWDRDGNFEEGTGDITAALFWRCAWIHAYVASSDPLATEESFDRLESWISLPEVADNTDDAMKSYWVPLVVAPARTGDDARLRAVGDTCGDP